MRRLAISAGIGTCLAIGSASPAVSASRSKQGLARVASTQKAMFGDWKVLSFFSPSSNRCVMTNGPFRVQISSDGKREIGGGVSHEEAVVESENLQSRDPGLFAVSTIVGKNDSYAIRLRHLVPDNISRSHHDGDVWIPDERMTLQVRSSHARMWKPPETLIDFLTKEKQVTLMPRLGFEIRYIDTSRLADALGWCNQRFSD